MPAAAAAIGLYAAGLGIYSFFAAGDDEVERNFQISQLRDGIDELQSLSTAVVNQNIAQSLGAAATALQQLELYRATEDSDARATFANNAILQSQNALNEVVSQADSAKGSASVESLAYMMGALQYTILVRQTVANVVQDGPLGGAGIHQSIKVAAQLMYDSVGSDDIYSEFPRAISSRITADELDVNIIQTKVEFSMRSSFSNRREDLELTRDAGFRDTFPFTPYVESNDSFEGRIDDAADAAFERIYAADYEEAGVSTLLAMAVDMNTWLAQDAINVPGLYERIGDSSDNFEEGTNNADFFTGLGGDDELSGENGPDALNGGSGNDILRGGGLQDVLTGGAGDDILFGNDDRSDGIDGDTARYDGLQTDYVVEGGFEYATVTGPDGSRDKLFNIEFLRFDDGVVSLSDGSALDGAGEPEDFVTAEIVALLYEAALNRDGNIDRSGLNFWIDVAERYEDDGLSQMEIIERLSDSFMVSSEFEEKFNDPATLSNADFLEQIYQNVLDRESDPEGFQFYLDLLDAETITRATALGDIAISQENTTESVDILMSLYESTTPEVHPITDILLDWYFIA